MLKTIEKTHKIIDAMPCEMAKKSYFRILKIKHGSSSAVEHWSPKPAVGSSNLSSRAIFLWRVGRVVEGARLESVYTSKGYREFESLALRLAKAKTKQKPVNRMIYRLLFFHPNQKPAKNINILVSDSVSRTEAEIYSPDSLQHITKQDVQKLNIL